MKSVAFAASILPAIWIAYQAATGDLGARPVTEAIHQAGDWALRFLFVTLAITPAQRVLHYPRIVLARSKEPLLSPSEDNREGYVPNVIYTCGALRCGEWIFMPYGVADSSIHFASIKIKDLLAHLGYDVAAQKNAAE